MTYCLSVLFTETKTEKKLKKLPKLRDDPNKIEAAAHKDAEAVPIINDDYSGVVGVVIGSVIGVSLIVALVKRNTHICGANAWTDLYFYFQGLAYFYKSRSKKNFITVKFNNPTFHLAGNGQHRRPQMGTDMENCHQMPTFVDRNTSASYIDLRPTI